jgi:hypothetical protein
LTGSGCRRTTTTSSTRATKRGEMARTPYTTSLTGDLRRAAEQTRCDTYLNSLNQTKLHACNAGHSAAAELGIQHTRSRR